MSTMNPLTSTSWFRLALSFLRRPRTDHLPSGYFSGIFEAAHDGCGGRSTLMGGSSCARTPAAAIVMTPRNAPQRAFFIRAIFITGVLVVQGCAARERRDPGSSEKPDAASLLPPPPELRRSGPVRIFIDAEPQGEGDPL